MEAWRKHVTGLEALVSSRGPQKYRSPLSRALLEDFRASLASLPSGVSRAQRLTIHFR